MPSKRQHDRGSCGSPRFLVKPGEIPADQSIESHRADRGANLWIEQLEKLTWGLNDREQAAAMADMADRASPASPDATGVDGVPPLSGLDRYVVTRVPVGRPTGLPLPAVVLSIDAPPPPTAETDRPQPPDLHAVIERRGEPRVALALDVVATYPGAADCRGTTIDVSVGGMSAEMPEPPHAVHQDFVVTDQHGTAQLWGQIVDSSPRGDGFRWNVRITAANDEWESVLQRHQPSTLSDQAATPRKAPPSHLDEVDDTVFVITPTHTPKSGQHPRRTSSRTRTRRKAI